MSDERGRKAPAGRNKSRTENIADRPADEVQQEQPSKKSPHTEAGQPVEEQIRKEWDPNTDGGLPTLLRVGAR